MSMTADTRLYASAIALVSGISSIGSAIASGMGMPTSDSVMLLLGVVVIAHGIVFHPGLLLRCSPHTTGERRILDAGAAANRAAGASESAIGLRLEGGIEEVALLEVIHAGRCCTARGQEPKAFLP